MYYLNLAMRDHTATFYWMIWEDNFIYLLILNDLGYAY